MLFSRRAQAVPVSQPTSFVIKSSTYQVKEAAYVRLMPPGRPRLTPEQLKHHAGYLDHHPFADGGNIHPTTHRTSRPTEHVSFPFLSGGEGQTASHHTNTDMATWLHLTSRPSANTWNAIPRSGTAAKRSDALSSVKPARGVYDGKGGGSTSQYNDPSGWREFPFMTPYGVSLKYKSCPA